VIGSLPGSSGSTGYAWQIEGIINSYAQTTFFKNYWTTAEGADASGNAKGDVEQFGGTWANTAAINSVKVFPISGNFVVGTLVTLYGRT
jgi:hypothetical protein